MPHGTWAAAQRLAVLRMMNLALHGRRHPDPTPAPIILRCERHPVGAESAPPAAAPFVVTLQCRTAPADGSGAARLLGAAVRFLIDATPPAVPPVAMLRMIGGFACAAGLLGPSPAVTLGLNDPLGRQARARLICPRFESETTTFGSAHILYEDNVLGLYILEIAPGRAIPAHCHRIMRECELVLDGGLLLRGRPAAPGAAFAWSFGDVHCYRNPTAVPRRILCIDSPRFQPGDERPVDPPPPLAPAVPFRTYLG